MKYHGKDVTFSKILNFLKWKFSCYYPKVIARVLIPISMFLFCRKMIPKHKLKNKLVISLTSYPARYSYLYLTLISLLLQSIRPDHIVLWIATEDMAKLPGQIFKLKKYGLLIKETHDTRSYKKIIPTLNLYPNTFIVTADDDVFYSFIWLKRLIQTWDGQPNMVTFFRGHQITFSENGHPKPYEEWKLDTDMCGPSQILFPTGVGGIFYPPNIFDSAVLDEEAFTSICPKADDIWLYWMARKNNSIYRRVSGKSRIVNWENSQDDALWHENLTLKHNDIYIENMINTYGWPC